MCKGLNLNICLNDKYVRQKNNENSIRARNGSETKNTLPVIVKCWFIESKTKMGMLSPHFILMQCESKKFVYNHLIILA
jgi:hypothetical protein